MAFSDIRPVLTIGHSHHSLDEFIQLLKKSGVEILVDIRSRPWNPFISSFSKDRMKMDLYSKGIVYFFMGHRLGLIPLDRSLIGKDQEVNYRAYEKSPDFISALEWIIERSREGQVCIMAGQADPFQCHRHWLIAQNLLVRGVSVIHLLEDGKKEVATADLFHYGETVEIHGSINKDDFSIN